jgi:PAS domain S-box-containing protein
MSDSSESLYKLILETANEGVWMIDENNRTSYVNKRMAKMIGYTSEDLIGKTPFEFISSEEEQYILTNLERRRKGIEEVSEVRLVHKNGDSVWTLMNSSPIITDGVYKGSLAMVTDVTERKLKDEVLKESYLKYMSLFEESPVPIWYEDFSQIKKYIDELKGKGVRNFVQFFSENPDELERCAESKQYVLDNFKSLITKDSAGYALRELLAISNNETSCEFEAQLRTFKGNIRYVQLKWHVVKGHEDTYKHVYLTTTDWTEKIVENNLELQRSNREKNTLLKEIHHRVKNNLQIISSLLNLQAGLIGDHGAREVFYVTLNRVHTMALVHELLYSSDNFSSINYRSYLEALISRLVYSMRETDLDISYRIEVNGIPFNINTALPLGLLINEIVTNSLKHAFTNSRQGEVYVEIETLKQDRYLLKAGDNGKGVTEKDLQNKDDSLGMQLIDSLTDQLNGELTFDNSHPGTHYRIEFSELS